MGEGEVLEEKAVGAGPPVAMSVVARRVEAVVAAAMAMAKTAAAASTEEASEGAHWARGTQVVVREGSWVEW